MSDLRRSDNALALRAKVRSHFVKTISQLREVYLLARLKAGGAQRYVRIVFGDYHYRATKAAALIALPVRRPFLFLANLCAELGVLFLKAEGYFLKLEKAHLKIGDEP